MKPEELTSFLKTATPLQLGAVTTLEDYRSFVAASSTHKLGLELLRIAEVGKDIIGRDLAILDRQADLVYEELEKRALQSDPGLREKLLALGYIDDRDKRVTANTEGLR